MTFGCCVVGERVYWGLLCGPVCGIMNCGQVSHCLCFSAPCQSFHIQTTSIPLEWPLQKVQTARFVLVESFSRSENTPFWVFCVHPCRVKSDKYCHKEWFVTHWNKQYSYIYVMISSFFFCHCMINIISHRPSAIWLASTVPFQLFCMMSAQLNTVLLEPPVLHPAALSAGSIHVNEGAMFFSTQGCCRFELIK